MTSATDPAESSSDSADSLRDIQDLRPGDQIEARDVMGTIFRGRIEETAPGTGLVWISEGPFGVRKMIDIRIHHSEPPVSHSDFSLVAVRKLSCNSPASSVSRQPHGGEA